jgi:hypothetical protein
MLTQFAGPIVGGTGSESVGHARRNAKPAAPLPQGFNRDETLTACVRV